MTSSAICPTVMATSASVVPPTVTMRPLLTVVRKPESSARTSYSPGSTFGMRYRPSGSVVASRSAPVATFLTLTDTPGSTPPLLSRATPASVPVAVWAGVVSAVVRRTHSARTEARVMGRAPSKEHGRALTAPRTVRPGSRVVKRLPCSMCGNRTTQSTTSNRPTGGRDHGRRFSWVWVLGSWFLEFSWFSVLLFWALIFWVSGQSLRRTFIAVLRCGTRPFPQSARRKTALEHQHRRKLIWNGTAKGPRKGRLSPTPHVGSRLDDCL